MKSNTFSKIMDILFLFNKNQSVLSVSGITSKLNLPISTTYRYIANLKTKGLIEEYGDKGHYRLGLKILELAQSLREQLSIADIALPIMQRLQKETEETIVLLSHQRNKVICIERIESNRSLRYSSEQGRTMFMHAGASSKVIMAHLDEAEQDRIIREEGLPRFTKNTIIDPRKLKEDLRSIRKQGFAISVGELDIGARGIAAPILDRNGKLIAGLSIVGPSDRITGSKIDKVTKIVIEAASEISKQINEVGRFLKQR